MGVPETLTLTLTLILGLVLVAAGVTLAALAVLPRNPRLRVLAIELLIWLVTGRRPGDR